MLKIGSLKLLQPTLLAPMAAFTDHVFRTLVDEAGGCGLLVSEMISAEGLRRRNRRTLQMLGDFPARTPQFVQLFGADPAALAEAAEIVAAGTGFCGIDFNMGCPVPKVARRGEGAALLKDMRRAAECIHALRRATPLPLSVKIRLGWSQVNVRETLAVVQAEGADAVTVHFRLAKDKYTQPARWEWADRIRSLVRIPLLGNGDIATRDEARARLQQVDGLAIGRGALADPFIFAAISGAAIGAERYPAFARRLCELIEAHLPPRLQLPRLKAYLRFFNCGGRLARAQKKEVFLAAEFAVAKETFLSTVLRVCQAPPGMVNK